MAQSKVNEILAKRARIQAAMTTPEPVKELPHEAEDRKKLALLSKVREVRARVALTKGAVTDGKPDKVYVWVNQRDDRRVSFEGMGYVLCTDPTVRTQWRKEDGTHRRGDLILYEIDKDLHEALKLDGEIRAIEQMAGSRESFHEFAAGNRINTFQPGG